MAAGASLCFVPAAAKACGTCAIGDPTLTALGNEQPLPHRLRPSLEYRNERVEVGTPEVNRLRIVDRRLNLALAYAPTAWLMLSLTVPWVWRQTREVNLQERRTSSVGDLLVQARWVVFRDRWLAPSHLLSVISGIRLPTAKLLRDGQGRLLPLEVQSGSGGFAGDLGLSYGWYGAPWSVYASSLVRLPTVGADSTRASRSWLSTALLQVQPWRFFSLRSGMNTRWDGRNVETNRPGPDSGGFIAFAHAGLLLSPLPSWLLVGSVDLPVAQKLRGFQREYPVYSLSVAYDWSGA